MVDLPTCWYCPLCRSGVDGDHTDIFPGHHPIKAPVFPPGTPLTVILDTLGIKYREGWENRGPGVDPFICFMGQTDKPVLVVPIPATSEAQDG